MESKRAAPWNTIPNRCRASVSSFPSSLEISSPSTRTAPRSGFSRPMTCFMSTVFPEPEPPSTTKVSPSTIESEIPLRTWFSPNDFQRSITSITRQAPTKMTVAA